MSLVVKSWSIKSRPAGDEPFARVVAREAGLLSFLLSLLGIDATTSLVVTRHGFEFEQGSLAGFRRNMTPFNHVSTVFYGRFKPWKVTGVFIVFSLSFLPLSVWLMLVGVVASLLFYYLNRELTVGFTESGGNNFGIVFKRSVVEGQEIDEVALRNFAVIVEALLRGDHKMLGAMSMGGAPSGARMAGVAPTNLGELVSGPKLFEAAAAAASSALCCVKCTSTLTKGEVFCSTCGTKQS